MRFKPDMKYLKISLYVFITLAALMIFWQFLSAFEDLWRSLLGMLSTLLTILKPFLLAVLFAYILLPAAIGIEKLLKHIWKSERFARKRQIASIATVYILLVSLVAFGIAYIIPGIVRNVMELINNFPTYVIKAQFFYEMHIRHNAFFQLPQVQEVINSSLVKLQSNTSQWGMSLLQNTFQVIAGTVGGVVNTVLSFVLSFYLLTEKEALAQSVQRVILARFGPKKSNSIFDFFKKVNLVFGGFISSKLLQVLIIYAVAQVTFLVLGLRYSVLMSVILSIFNIIPYIGPVVGAIPPILIGFLDSPVQGIAVVIAIVVIQFLDGYVLGPRLFSDKLGLSPFWVIFALVVAGGLFGFWGVMLAIPIAGVIRLMVQQYVHNRRNRIPKEP